VTKPTLALAFVMAVSLWGSTAAFAVPAAPTVHTLTQPSGATIQAVLRGDEHGHWWQTLDGQIVAQDARTGSWLPSSRPVTTAAASARRRTAVAPQRIPTTGTNNIAVLCVNFSDTATTYVPTDFNTLLFSGARSMKAYYTEVSGGKFTVGPGPGGVGGWYTASNTHDYYGQNGAGGDLHLAELVIETIKAADAAGFNFAPYDQNKDGYVDSVSVIHQGAGEETGAGDNNIWSCSWDLNSAQAFGDGTGEVATNDGVKVNSFIIQPEHQYPGTALVTVGVYCHEYGHALGLPDLYDYGYDSSGLGDWSLMAGGSWNGNGGDLPAHMDAWCKASLGWITPIIAVHQQGVVVPQTETNPWVMKIEATGATGSEYFLIENRQKTGFDAGLPGAGLLIYHVDDSVSGNDNQWYPGLPSISHYQVALEQADNRYNLEHYNNEGDAGDPYPGTSGNRTFDDTSNPTAALYDGAVSPLVVRNISNSGPSMTIDIMDITFPLAPKTIQAVDTPNDEGGSATVTWSKSGDDGRGANDVVGYNVFRAGSASGPFTKVTASMLPKGTTSYADATVTDGLSYWYKVAVQDASGNVTESKAAGPAVPRNDAPPPQVTNLIAADTPGDSGSSITLSWSGYTAPLDFARYNVYRSAASFNNITETGVTRIATITDVGLQTYVDRPTTDGTRFWYAVTASDNVSDSVAPDGNENPSVLPSGPVFSSPNYTFNFPVGTSMIAVGATPVSTDMATILGIPAADLLLARYDPATSSYRTYQSNPSDSFLQHALGRAYWLSLSSALSVDIAGLPTTEDTYPVSFSSGWNMIGNPYPADIDTAGLSVVVAGITDTLAGAAARNWVRDYMWAYDAFTRSYKLVSPTISFADKTVRKGRGVFIRAFTDGTLQFARPVVSSQTTTSEAIQADWALRLVAETQNGADTDNFVGVSSQAAALNKILGPPAQIVDLYFDGANGAHTAACFADRAAQSFTASVKVAAQQAGSVTLKWPDLSGLPADVKPVLVDLASGKRIYLRTVSGYTFDAEAGSERAFTLEVNRDDAVSALAVRSLSAHTSGLGAEVVFTLSKDATVRADVLNVAGRVVRSIALATPVSGGTTTTLAWDGRSSAGTRVPGGRYLLRITASCEDGQTVSGTTALNLNR
jgi:immune inhibitor A